MYDEILEFEELENVKDLLDALEVAIDDSYKPSENDLRGIEQYDSETI